MYRSHSTNWKTGTKCTDCTEYTARLEQTALKESAGMKTWNVVYWKKNVKPKQI